MHRLAASVAALVVVVFGVAACANGGSTASAEADATVSAAAGSSVGGPSVGTDAFSGHGRLAFVSDDRLYVLDGDTAGKPAALHAVVTGKVPGTPGSPRPGRPTAGGSRSWSGRRPPTAR